MYPKFQDELTMVNLEDLTGSVRDLLSMENVRREVSMQFKKFLSSYRGRKNELVYIQRINQMAEDNRDSLEVSYLHLISQVSRLAVWLAECPALMLELLDKVATKVRPLRVFTNPCFQQCMFVCVPAW
jgi:DNA replication licensing factor MCM2